MMQRYTSKNYPSEFPVRSKCVGLFQKIHGVDTLLFAMYVYEYGHDCPPPNKRRVYISYLDSAQYFEPKCYRTTAYQTIIIEYLRYVKQRGFHTAAMWSCPPVGGDDYIFYCHPKHQLIPQEDMLRSWYHKMLDHAKNQGVVIRTSTLYDEYFSSDAIDQAPGQRHDPTCLPYFEGDYIPGEIENIIQQLDEKNENGSSAVLQDTVMMRLGHSIKKMKDNFIVVHLRNRRFAAAVERGEDVSNWKEDSDDDMIRSKRAKISGKCPTDPNEETSSNSPLKCEIGETGIDSYKAQTVLGKNNTASETATLPPLRTIGEKEENTLMVPDIKIKDIDLVVDEPVVQTMQDNVIHEPSITENRNDSGALANAVSGNTQKQPLATHVLLENEMKDVVVPADASGPIDLKIRHPIDASSKPADVSAVETDGGPDNLDLDVADITQADYYVEDSKSDKSATVEHNLAIDALASGVQSEVQSISISGLAPGAKIGINKSGKEIDVAVRAAADNSLGSVSNTVEENLELGKSSFNYIENPDAIGDHDRSNAVPPSSEESLTVEAGKESDGLLSSQLTDATDKSAIDTLNPAATDVQENVEVDQLNKSSNQKRYLDEMKPAISVHLSGLSNSVAIVGGTTDDDPPMESEMFESRQQFLNYCQTTHCQFDELRRAKHSTVMVLFQLHNPMAPKFLQQCGACYRDITHGIYFHCNDCSNFDLCEECHEPVTSGLWAKRDPRFAHDNEHTFKSVDMEGDEEPQKNEGDRQKGLSAHVELIEHAAACPGLPDCSLMNCKRMKTLFNHVPNCVVTPKKDCKVCTRLFALCTIHSRLCSVRNSCPIPFCDRIRERNKRLRRQQQLMDDRRRQAQNELYHAGGNA